MRKRSGHEHAHAFARAGQCDLDLEGVKAEGEGIEALVGEVDERPHEFVPGGR